LRFFTLKFVKYVSIILILKQKITKNAPKQAKRSALADVSCKKSSQNVFRDALNLQNRCAKNQQKMPTLTIKNECKIS